MGEEVSNNEELNSQTELELSVSEDRLTAHLSGACPPDWDRRQIQYAITNLLKEQGVKYGLDAQSMRQAIDRILQGHSIEKVLVARGQLPTKGTDAEITMHVDLVGSVVGREQKGGKVDFRDRGPIPTVEPGTVLATLKKGLRGDPGKDVYGNVLHAEESRMLRLLGGEGVEIVEDGTKAVSTVVGMVARPEEEKIQVKNVLVVKEDVDLNTGHIDFPGAVKVCGTIRSDFKVKCYSLETETIEPRAVIEVKNDLMVYAGIMGAAVRVGGDLAARFVRDAKVICNGDVVVDTEIVQSVIQAGGMLKVSGLEGRIVDSHLAAIKGISAGDVLCSRSEATILRIGVNPEFEKQYWSYKKNLESALNQQNQITEAVNAQEKELISTEEELRDLISLFHKTQDQKERENQLTQINMIKPLREALKQGVDQGGQRLAELVYEIQRLKEKVRKMEQIMPAGATWLDVRGRAEQGVQIRTPRASATLEKVHQAFSAREVLSRDKNTNEEQIAVKMTKLRMAAK